MSTLRTPPPLEPILREVRARGDAPRRTGEARRLFHGRGRSHPGYEFLTIEFFPPTALLQLHLEQPPAWLRGLALGVAEALAGDAECILLQRRHVRGAPTEVLAGRMPRCPRALEDGLTYRLRLGRAQNAGFFLDMAEGRRWVRRNARGRRVLNLFAYTCAFSVVALAGGAADVVNLDMNRGALETGRANHRDNGLDLRRASFLPHNLFKSFGRLRRLGPFDLAVLDPPGDQGASFRAERDWPRLLKRLPPLLAPEALVLGALSTPHLGRDFLRGCFERFLPEARIDREVPPSPDFPERNPDQELKVTTYRWRPP